MREEESEITSGDIAERDMDEVIYREKNREREWGTSTMTKIVCSRLLQDHNFSFFR